MSSDDVARPRLEFAGVVAVFLGGVVGGLARFETVQHWTPTATFPWATLWVNTSGAFVLAVLLVLSERRLSHLRFFRPALGTGFCGSFTTFSAVVTSSDLLAAHGHVVTAALYVVASVIAGLMAAFLGFGAARTLAKARSIPEVDAAA